MAGSVNKVILVGNVGKDPEVRSLQDGKEVINITLATSESWRDNASGERKERTEWHRVVVFNQGLISVIKNYVRKGSKLYIEGALQTRKWTDQSGVERYSTEIVLQNFNGVLTMLDNRGAGESHDSGGGFGATTGAFGGGATATAAQPAFAEADLDDDIPF